jgi:hypothetical protein
MKRTEFGFCFSHAQFARREFLLLNLWGILQHSGGKSKLSSLQIQRFVNLLYMGVVTAKGEDHDFFFAVEYILSPSVEALVAYRHALPGIGSQFRVTPALDNSRELVEHASRSSLRGH